LELVAPARLGRLAGRAARRSDGSTVRGWGIAKHLAWGLSDDYRGPNIEQARLIAEAIG
jgi:hypothetical protein